MFLEVDFHASSKLLQRRVFGIKSTLQQSTKMSVSRNSNRTRRQPRSQPQACPPRGLRAWPVWFPVMSEGLGYCLCCSCGIACSGCAGHLESNNTTERTRRVWVGDLHETYVGHSTHGSSAGSPSRNVDLEWVVGVDIEGPSGESHAGEHSALEIVRNWTRGNLAHHSWNLSRNIGFGARRESTSAGRVYDCSNWASTVLNSSCWRVQQAGDY
jgi:hypothetical protein